MSEAVDVVRAIFAGWERGDFTSDDWMHPEITFVGGDGVEARGPHAIRARWADFLGSWDRFVVLAEEIIDAGGGVVLVLVRFEGRGRGSGTPLEGFSGANLFTIRDGKVARLVLYTDRREARRAAGLPE